MKFLQGGMLWKHFQASSTVARERVWVASPYIGEWNTIRTLLGTTWWHDPGIDFRVLTDFDEAGNYVSLDKLFNRGTKIRSLVGLHAKVYIFDSLALITSANFTRAGFNKLFEAGVALDADESKDAVAYFQMLWSQSLALSDAQLARLKAEPEVGKFKDQRAERPLADRWGMPPAPPEFSFENSDTQSGYLKFVANFRELSSLYEETEGRIWADMPLALEVDAFLNFLLHEHPSKPSANHYGPGLNTPRNLTSEQRRTDVEHYTREFHAHEALDDENRLWRKQTFERFAVLLSRDRLNELSTTEVNEIVKSLHTMNAYHYTLPRFLNTDRNSTDKILESWYQLLYGSEPVEERIKSSVQAIYGMGENSIQELLGWHSPNRYPIRNSNTDAGMLFFGYPF
jgi:hypothetical protein